MKMECCYPFRFWLAVLSEAVLLLVVVVYLTMGNGAGVAVFGGLAVLYALLNRSAFSFVFLDENGVTQYLLGIRQKTYAWSDIREAGVIYAKAVKRRAKGKRPSQCSLYVTPRRMNSQERLEACMDWPPPNVIGMAYQEKRLQLLMRWWDQKLILFNVSSQDLFGRDGRAFDLTYEEIRY